MNNKSAKKIIFSMAIFTLLAVNLIFGFIYYKVSKVKTASDNYDNDKQKYIIELNEVWQLEQNVDAREKLQEVIEQLRDSRDEKKDDSVKVVITVYIVCNAILIIIFLYVYITILMPFDRLENYADEIAKGNLEKSFDYNRKNMFGKFTWAFDHMRTEIIIARKNERDAVENNKTVIATLSHDIKTPVASIKGYAEGLIMNMDTNSERRKRYADVIIKKCDEVAKITDDIFIHSLHDLDKLEIKEEIVDLKTVIRESIDNLKLDDDIKIVGELQEGKIEKADRNRINQVIGNIITNSRKYAATDIEISSRIILNSDNILPEKDSNIKLYELSIRDFGPGICDEDVPFIFEKFYRGKNVKDKQGAGLGLFIVKYIMTHLGGDVRITNYSKGLEVKLYFELYES